MANFESNRLDNRRPAQRQLIAGYSPQLIVTPTPPPGPWKRLTPDGFQETWDLEPEDQTHGSMIAVNTTKAGGIRYSQLYVYIDGVDTPGWKKVDVYWPKIDPSTGQQHDQYLGWYSPLAE